MAPSSAGPGRSRPRNIQPNGRTNELHHEGADQPLGSSSTLASVARHVAASFSAACRRRPSILRRFKSIAGSSDNGKPRTIRAAILGFECRGDVGAERLACMNHGPNCTGPPSAWSYLSAVCRAAATLVLCQWPTAFSTLTNILRNGLLVPDFSKGITNYSTSYKMCHTVYRYYEWRRTANGKQPMDFTAREARLH